jgi:preprotein translocase subunit YajC
MIILLSMLVVVIAVSAFMIIRDARNEKIKRTFYPRGE